MEMKSIKKRVTYDRIILRLPKEKTLLLDGVIELLKTKYPDFKWSRNAAIVQAISDFIDGRATHP